MLRIGLVFAALGLIGCGDAGDDNVLSQVTGLIIDSRAEAEPPTQLAVTEEQLLSTRGQYLRVNIRELGRADTMVQVGANGDRTTWIDSAQISLTMENGIVVATRGLRRDLMGADAGATAQAIRAGGGSAMRQHDFLDDQDQIVTNVLDCQILRQEPDEVRRFGQTIPAIRFEETCTSDGLSLTNVYWVNSQRGIVRSLQAVSPDAGYLQIDVF